MLDESLSEGREIKGCGKLSSGSGRGPCTDSRERSKIGYKGHCHWLE